MDAPARETGCLQPIPCHHVCITIIAIMRFPEVDHSSSRDELGPAAPSCRSSLGILNSVFSGRKAIHYHGKIGVNPLTPPSNDNSNKSSAYPSTDKIATCGNGICVRPHMLAHDRRFLDILLEGLQS
jgi:hypothetical protein